MKYTPFIKWTLVLGCLVLSNAKVIAQSGSSNESSSGSIYSSFGVGFPVDVTSSAFKAQGILGISSIDNQTSGIANPALWGNKAFTQTSSGVQLSKYFVSSTGAEKESSLLESGYLHMVFPLNRGKSGLSVALYPVTRSNYNVNNVDSFTPSASDTVYYMNERTSSGGINKFEIGFGWKLSNHIMVGYAPSIAFLSLKETENLDLPASSGYYDQVITSKFSGTALSHRFGVSSRFKGFLRGNDVLAVGATVILPFQIKAKQQLLINKYGNNDVKTVDYSDELDREKGAIKIPVEAAIGFSYYPSYLFTVSGEGQYQQWGNFENDLDPASEKDMKNRIKVGFGGQYHPYKLGFDSFLSKFKYSAGLSYDSGFLTLSNQDINTLWLSTGLGILSQRSRSTIDISFQYGFRGTTDNNLIKERIWALGLSVNLSELMFIRPKLR